MCNVKVRFHLYRTYFQVQDWNNESSRRTDKIKLTLLILGNQLHTHRGQIIKTFLVGEFLSKEIYCIFAINTILMILYVSLASSKLYIQQDVVMVERLFKLDNCHYLTIHQYKSAILLKPPT